MLECERLLREKSECERHAVESLRTALHIRKAAVLAVSGGPDSIALMLLAADLRASGTAPPLFVATVDHGLRPESRQEAEQVAAWAQALDLPHKILVWQGEKPKTRIQERARDARYDLLYAYAVEIGADCIVTAHHADDQAETILFRLFRGSGLKGLSGMAAAVPRGGVIHARPLLDLAKADLIGFCHARSHPFFDDPSNRNPAYARTRMRSLAGVMAEHGLDRDGLLRLGARAARADAALQAQAQALAADLRNIAEKPAFRADFSSLKHQPEEILSRILEVEIRAVSGSDAPLRLDRLESLALRMRQALHAGEALKATLGGVTLHLNQDTYLDIRLENPRKRGIDRRPEGRRL